MDIKTVCTDCIFFEHQYCDLDVHNKLKRHNYKNIKFTTVNTSPTERIHVIDNHVCVFCRNKQWKDIHKDKDLKQLVRNEVILRATVLVYISQDTLPNITKNLTSIQNVLYNSRLLPREIIYINHTDYKISTIKTLCQKLPTNYSYIKWSLETIIDADTTRDAAIDITSTKIKTPYFMSINADSNITTDLLSDLDVALNDNLDKFVIATNHRDIFFVNTTLFKTVGCNLEKPALEKITNILTEQDSLYLLKDL